MNINIRKKEFEHVTLFGKPALFTGCRIAKDTVPDGCQCYDFRGSDNDPGKPEKLHEKSKKQLIVIDFLINA